jgi:tricorn protease
MRPLRFLAPVLALALLVPIPVAAQSEPLGFARDPHFHDGQVVFSFRGDLWVVGADGSNPHRLTSLHDASDTRPRYSPDGQWIAFTSDRNGSDDVYVMPASGGEATRLTWHSGSDDVEYWTPDGERIVFSSSRGPMAWESPLYTVGRDGGLPEAIPMGAGATGMYSQDGRMLTFNRRGYRDPKRNYRGSNTTDVWVTEVGSGTFRQLTDPVLSEYKEHVNDAYPMFGGDGWIYFASERSGRFNVWKVNPEGGSSEQVTRFDGGGVRFPSMSADGSTIAFHHDFDLWILPVSTGTPRRVPVNLGFVVDRNLTETASTQDEADSFSPSPDGSYLAVEFRGEIFVVPTEEGVGETKRVTNSAWRQGSAVYSPDGRFVAYLSDESTEEEVWIAELATGERRKLTDQPSKKSIGLWSPASDRVFFTSGTTVFAAGVSGGTTEIVDNHAGGYQLTQVSPDGRWLVMERSDDLQNLAVVLYDTEDGVEYDITDHRSRDTGGMLTPDGNAVLFLSNRDGGTTQLFRVELETPTEDPNDPLVRERLRGAQDEDEDEEQAGQPIGITVDPDDIARRAVQLTDGSDAVSNAFLSSNGQTVYYVTGTGNQRSLWSLSADGEGEPRKIADGAFQDLEVTGDRKTVFYRQGDEIRKLVLSEREPARVRFSLAFSVDKREEWREMFDEFYRHWKYSYVEADMHGYDWDGIRQRHEPLVEKIAQTDDFYMLVEEMLFELEASHTGVSRPSTGGGGRGGGAGNAPDPNRTRFTGFEIEPDQRGLRITHVYRDGPADRAWLDIEEGDYLLAINGTPVGPTENYWKLLTGLLNEYVTVTVADRPDAPSAERRDQRIQTVTSLSSIKYEDWVTRNREYVDSATNGRIAYFHMRSMNQGTLDRLKQEIDENFDKQGMILDVRYNGGGNIDQQLMDVLLRRPYQYTWTRTGSPVWGRRPQQLIAGPQVMIENWRSNSNAEMVPHAFKHLELGTLVGTPTNGAVVSARQHGLLDGGSVRIPAVRVVSYDPTRPNNFGFDLENYGVPPDIFVRSSPEDELRGFDRELDTAVQEALRLLRTGTWQHVTDPDAGGSQDRGRAPGGGGR